MKNTYYILISFLFFLNSCNNHNFNEPTISLDSYVVEDGFSLKAIAAEPFIEAPVSMSFDDKGRIWVVQMKAYMQNLEGTGEDTPNGRISILEDLDNDGVTDHVKVFLDSLVLPRAIAHVYGGLLYAEPPNLWFVDIENDKPKNKVLVDAHYTKGGNVEHRPNGLMMNIDNWIYNAKSSARYQRKNGVWIKEQTSFRGQWGISKDNFGRIYHNNNSVVLKGDLVLPNTHTKNPFFNPSAALGKKLTPNQKIYPLHATSINRGYIKGRLDKDSIVINATAACSPLIYRGNQFGKNYNENAFVCIPEGNLIKRIVLTQTSNNIHGKQAIPEQEFIASTDEGFRPVNLFNGPDGSIYIVDMHRGILQDKAFLTPYLKNLYSKKKLDTIMGMGRILKVEKNNNPPFKIINFNNLKTKELVQLLEHSNGWYRDRAQQLLITKKDYSSVILLKKLIKTSKNSIAQIHALHTLNGLDAISFNYLEEVITYTNQSKTTSHALVLLEKFANSNYSTKMLILINSLIHKKDSEIDLYISNSLGNWMQLAPKNYFPVLTKIADRYKDQAIYQEGIISSVRGLEAEFLFFAEQKKLNPILIKLLNSALEKKIEQQLKQNKKQKNKHQKSIKSGQKIFNNICATCHGNQGQGIESLAPPFVKSEYISESLDRLALILLHGLSGPIHVNGERYNLAATMPGLGNNPEYTDEDIQNIIYYLQDTFSQEEKNISIQKIKSLRKTTPKEGVFTEKELLKIK
ncbi:mono/diheme cytochrome c family protein [Wenyingzhuangia heitensis]|uniref:Mono/diheme cytochrome c family protein n=1 Tax=Wenyingzhuangia heitensis TaxID=1487859 RepID=A0ABX0UG84_9FLAO|nr:c-type cytochrome [Wenyingzhuangia heitensis]NIJ46201.1 mono/diheme cytochrome c family protein [Wenyingzhuangia heitensis]